MPTQYAPAAMQYAPAYAPVAMQYVPVAMPVAAQPRPMQAVPAPVPTVPNDGPQPIVFEGFVHTQPLLAERPTRFFNRVDASLTSLFAVPNGDPYGGMNARMHISPIFTIPVPLLFGNELFPNEVAAEYPFAQQPLNHPWNPDEQDVDEYLLGLYAFLVKSGMLRCEGHDLWCYPTGEWEAEDEPWAWAQDWARDTAPNLIRLNLARLTAFSGDDPEEQRVLMGLYEMWGLTDSPAEALNMSEDMVQATGIMLQLLADDGETYDFRPYEED